MPATDLPSCYTLKRVHRVGTLYRRNNVAGVISVGSHFFYLIVEHHSYTDDYNCHQYILNPPVPLSLLLSRTVDFAFRHTGLR